MNRRLLVACVLAALVAVPTLAAPQDITTLLSIFLRNLHAGRVVIPVSTLFASLPSASNGTIVYCSDCAEATTPCSGSGSGAFALRQGGQWVCPDGGSGGSGVSDAEYWVGAAHADLSAEKNLGLFTGLVLNTTGTPSAYAGTSCTNQFPRSLNASGAATCASVGLTSDVTGTLPVANGGMPAATSLGTIAAYNGSAWVTMTPCATGEFIRWNPGASDGIDCVPGPNISDQNADVSSTSSASASFLTDMVFAPEPDTWFGVSCTILYQTAATTTGIGIGLFANDIGATAPAQFFSSKFTIGGFGAAGTDSDWVGHTSSSGSLVVTTGVQSTTAWYVIKIDALILTHATDTDAFIAPQFRSEVNLSAVTIKEGSYCKGYALHVDS